jgi:hypothetical protein
VETEFRTMDRKRQPQLLTLDQVVQALCLDVTAVEHLVATGQLPELHIERERRFDERDLIRLIDTYKHVQKRRTNDLP